LNEEEFYDQLQSRTLAYMQEFKADPRPVVVHVGTSAHSRSGHVALLGLTNMLARAHRRILVVGDLDRELSCHDPFGRTNLEEAVVTLARGVNPFIDIDVSTRMPEDPLIAFGLAAPAEVQIGFAGWSVEFSEGATIADDSESVMGAILGACLAASVAFHRQIGASDTPKGPFSLWDYVRPSVLRGPKLEEAFDVGRVLQVGVGAVGAALNYWMSFLGFRGLWTLVDGDAVDVTNLNRQLFFLAEDAGWQGLSRNKALVVAERLGAQALPSPRMYGEDQMIVDADYDIVLALANEGGVRPALQGRAEPVLLHATTTRNWTAISHRHVAGVDDCIVCRLPTEEDPSFTCSTGEVPIRERSDASLPFLAGLAGALLLRDLIALQNGELLQRKTNFASINLREPTPFTSEYRWTCGPNCMSRLPAAVRLALVEGSRYSDLDGER
jgi:hypothetical protein